jgi:hypothetical protein
VLRLKLLPDRILDVAIYTTFFVSDPEHLIAGFPGWRHPLPEPIKRQIKNPFTGETTTLETREPDWHEDEVAGPMEHDYQVLAMTGNYEDYLEGRLPCFVQQKPHWAAKGLTEVELSPLAQAAGVETKFECPLYGPPSSGAILQELPCGLAPKLVSLDENGLKALAVKWAATMSAPEYTHSMTGVKLNNGWAQSYAMEILQAIVALARKESAGQRMYLLTEA